MRNLILAYESYLSSLVAYHRIMKIIEANKAEDCMTIFPDIIEGRFVLTIVSESEQLLDDLYGTIQLVFSVVE